VARPNARIWSRKNGFSIRLARPEDLADARRVIVDVLDEALGGYRPDVHWDLDKLEETYLEQPRYALFVATDDTTGTVIGTTAVRPGGPKSPPHPKWVADRYDPVKTAQLYRVYIRRDERRRGAARELVAAARAWVSEEGGFDVIYLHTDPRSPGAERFWRTMPTIVEICDDAELPAIHFELPMREAPASPAD